MLPLKCKIKLPNGTEPGSFGAVRRHDIHTGLDLYCNDGEPVYAVEDGIIANYGPFTGIGAGSDWWEDTDFLCVKGRSGKVLYGEIALDKSILSSTNVREGDVIGRVKRVLRADKGLPMTMLHIELYDADYAGTGEVWHLGEPKPAHLQDVTALLRRELRKERDRRGLTVLAFASALVILILFLNIYYMRSK